MFRTRWPASPRETTLLCLINTSYSSRSFTAGVTFTRESPPGESWNTYSRNRRLRTSLNIHTRRVTYRSWERILSFSLEKRFSSSANIFISWTYVNQPICVWWSFRTFSTSLPSSLSDRESCDENVNRIENVNKKIVQWTHSLNLKRMHQIDLGKRRNFFSNNLFL